jgi:hypothetical protein
MEKVMNRELQTDIVYEVVSTKRSADFHKGDIFYINDGMLCASSGFLDKEETAEWMKKYIHTGKIIAEPSKTRYLDINHSWFSARKIDDVLSQINRQKEAEK